MTPANHLRWSDQWLHEAKQAAEAGDMTEALSKAMLAQGHALTALAAQLGVPHDHPANPGVPSVDR